MGGLPIVEITVATAADMEELASVEVESRLKSFAENEPYALDYNSRLHRWQTYFNRESPAGSKPERVVLKAVVDRQIIGYLAGHLTTRFDLDAEIQSFFVLKEHQRTGIGSMLLEKFKEWLVIQNAKSVCVGIDPGNLYQAFYLKHGGTHLNEHWIVWQELV